MSNITFINFVLLLFGLVFGLVFGLDRAKKKMEVRLARLENIMEASKNIENIKEIK